MTPRPLDGRPPRLKAPPGTCDTHIHVYPPGHGGLPGTPLPPPATIEEYRRYMRWIGIARAVVVQPNAYGDDNSATMAAVAALGDAARAVVVVKPGASDAELERLTRAGARGIRFMALLGGTLSWADMDEMAARVHGFGWHAIVQLDGRTLPDHVAQIRRLPGRFVIDHIGKFLEPVAPDHAGFKALLGLVETGRCWVKLAAAYETSKLGPPLYEDVGRLARLLVKAAPERMLWASNWPHAQAAKVGYPDDPGLLDLLLDWAPDEAQRRRILVDNPAELYGFRAGG
jgi:D-galactarolactone isomerase